jgi:hypothetical protein
MSDTDNRITLGAFTLATKLGEGGLECCVAIKFICPDVLAKPSFTDRFEREALPSSISVTRTLATAAERYRWVNEFTSRRESRNE